MISILVPTYRAGRHLLELCASLQAQTYRDFEVLILSDGTDDHLQPGMQKFAADPRFHIRAWEKNQGVSRATGELFRLVRGDYWCYPGADDLLRPEFLARRLAVATGPVRPDVIFGRGVQIDEHGADFWYHPARVVSQRLEPLEGTTIPSTRLLPMLLQDNIVNTPSIFCRSAATLPVLRAAAIEWRYAQDHHYWILLAACVPGFFYDGAILHEYRMHASQLSRTPELQATRLAEIRLVPLVALSQAAALSDRGAACWQRWRRELFALWMVRAALLARQRQFKWAWQRQAAAAYFGPQASRIGLAFAMCWGLALGIWLRRDERRLAARQITVNGLRRIDDPIFRQEPASAQAASPQKPG